MANILNKIVEVKLSEIQQIKNPPPLADLLCEPSLSVIAEIKRQSPSAGKISGINDPVELALNYKKGGASAISVLTDKTFFGGSLADLRNVVNACPDMPVLRKDFILDQIQLNETKRAGATIVLLIVAILKDKLSSLLEKALGMGFDVITEVHDETELKIALEAGAKIIGVNNRNLDTFEVSLQTAERLKKQIPKGILTIAESGIFSIDDAKRMKDAGFNGVLIGEALVRSGNPVEFIQQIKRLP